MPPSGALPTGTVTFLFTDIEGSTRLLERQGQVMAEVVVDMEGGHELVSAITAESARRLGLAPGKRVVAVIKSTEVMLAVND
jgi:molybdopterin-binding protein